MESIRKLTDLKDLAISEPTEEDLKAIAAMPSLEKLTLHCHWLDAGLLQNLRHSSSLIYLDITTGLSDAHPLPADLKLSNIERIYLHIIPSWISDPQEPARNTDHGPADIAPIDVATIPHDQNIVGLQLVCASLIHPDQIAQHKQLQSLMLHLDTVQTGDLKEISTLPILSDLLIHARHYAEDDLLPALANSHLERFSVANPTPSVLALAAHWANPKKLSLQIPNGNYLKLRDDPSLLIADRDDTIQVYDVPDRMPATLRPLWSQAASISSVEMDNYLATKHDRSNQMTSPLFSSLAQLPALKRLWFRTGALELTNEYASQLSKLTNLEEIDVWVPWRGAADTLKLLTPLHKLRRLDLSETDLTDSSANLLASFHNLSSLNLSQTSIGESWVAESAKLPALEYLNLSGTGLKNLNISPLLSSPLHKLTTLDLSRTGLGDDAMIAVAKFTQLKDLNLTHTKITAAGLAKLVTLQHLKKINLTNTHISGLSPRVFSSWKDLVDINLSGTDLTDVDIPAILACSAASVDLSYTWIAPKSLQQLNTIRHLRKLNLSGITTRETARSTLRPDIEVTVWPSNFDDRSLAPLESKALAYAARWKAGDLDLTNLLDTNRLIAEWKIGSGECIGPSPAALDPDFSRRSKRARFCATAWIMGAQRRSEQFFTAAVANLANKQFRDAAEEFSFFIRGASSSAIGYQYRALAYLMLGDYPKAAVDLDRAQAINPKLPAIYAYRAELESRLGHQEEAKKNREIARSLGYHPEFPPINF